MNTILIQINNDKAYKLIEDLEELHLIKVLRKDSKPTQKLSEKYAGKLSDKVADEMQEYISQSRNQCNNRNI